MYSKVCSNSCKLYIICCMVCIICCIVCIIYCIPNQKHANKCRTVWKFGKILHDYFILDPTRIFEIIKTNDIFNSGNIAKIWGCTYYAYYAVDDAYYAADDVCHAAYDVWYAADDA